MEVPNVVEFSAEYHKIPHEQFSFPKIEKVLRDVHAFTHTVKIDTDKEAFVFVKNDEIDQVRDVFNWFQIKSHELGLGLKWRVTLDRKSVV